MIRTYFICLRLIHSINNRGFTSYMYSFANCKPAALWSASPLPPLPNTTNWKALRTTNIFSVSQSVSKIQPICILCNAFTIRMRLGYLSRPSWFTRSYWAHGRSKTRKRWHMICLQIRLYFFGFGFSDVGKIPPQFCLWVSSSWPWMRRTLA